MLDLPPLHQVADATRTLLVDIPDDRDHIFDVSSTPTPLPDSVDLSALMPPVLQQSHLESCTAHALSSAIQFERRKQNLVADFTPSRLFIWYNERYNAEKENLNVGASLRDGVKSLVSLGVCSEELLPYDLDKYQDRPSDQCFSEAQKYRIASYKRLPGFIEMKACLASGYPFAFGMFLFEPISAPQGSEIRPIVSSTGEYPNPQSHAMLAVGYDDASSRFLIRNSWGAEWGKNGYFTIPYWLFRSPIVFDAWTIRG